MINYSCIFNNTLSVHEDFELSRKYLFPHDETIISPSDVLPITYT
jgi:hypothetical protein